MKIFRMGLIWLISLFVVGCGANHHGIFIDELVMETSEKTREIFTEYFLAFTLETDFTEIFDTKSEGFNSEENLEDAIGAEELDTEYIWKFIDVDYILVTDVNDTATLYSDKDAYTSNHFNENFDINPFTQHLFHFFEGGVGPGVEGSEGIGLLHKQKAVLVDLDGSSVQGILALRRSPYHINEFRIFYLYENEVFYKDMGKHLGEGIFFSMFMTLERRLIMSAPFGDSDSFYTLFEIKDGHLVFYFTLQNYSKKYSDEHWEMKYIYFPGGPWEGTRPNSYEEFWPHWDKRTYITKEEFEQILTKYDLHLNVGNWLVNAEIEDETEKILSMTFK